MSPRLPRDVSGVALAKSLAVYGYVVTRQKGSHLRLTTQNPHEHHITVPNHDALRAGTLSSILNAVAKHAGISREDVVESVFR